MIKSLIKRMVPRSSWERMAKMRWQFALYRAIARNHVRAIGWSAAIRLLPALWFKQHRAKRKAQRVLRSIHMSGYRYPLYFRPWSSDPKVISQVFVGKEYDCVGSEPEVAYIIDCGANIGCTTFYLLHRYPFARAVVVEPDAENMQLCRLNLAPFADRVTFVESGVWSRSTSMVVERGNYRDGREWAYQIRPAESTETGCFMALTISDLLVRGNFPKIDLLKIDIEAAEAEVFAHEPYDWLDRTRTLVIELHGPHCEKVVAGTLDSYCFQSDHSGELTVFRNIERKADMLSLPS